MLAKQTEYQLHVQFWQWCQYHPPLDDYIFAIEHGEIRSPFVGAKLKKKGVKAGMSDYLLPIGNNEYNNLWLEFKVGSNKQTKAQQQFQAQMEECGGKYVICHDLEEAIKEIEDYTTSSQYI